MPEPLGRFGKRHLASLKANRPDEYKELKESGQLDQYLREMDEHAASVFQSELKARLDKDPGPMDGIGQSQRLLVASQQAEEVVNQDLLVPDEETEKAMKTGYVD
jgi:hypothetical protein